MTAGLSGGSFDPEKGSKEPRENTQKKLDAAAARALEELYAQFAPRAYSYLRSRGMDPDSAQELLHDVFLKIGRYLRDGHSMENPQAFVFSAVHRRFLDWLRGGHRRSRPSEDVGRYEPDAFSELEFENMLDRHDQQPKIEALKVAIAGLTARQRDVIKMHYLAGLSSGEIARELKISEGTVRSHLSEGRERLKGLLDDAGSHGEEESR